MEMTKVLKQKPQTLRSLLAAHQRDLAAQIRLHAGDAPQAAQLRAALTKVNAALERLDQRLAAAYEEDEATEEDETVDDALEGDPLEDDEDAVEELEEAINDEFLEGDIDEDDLESEEEIVEDEPATPAQVAREAVQMNNRMRRQMGDPAADFLDDYAFLLHKKVTQFFKELDRKALMLGDEDDDGETSLRERLREEVGRRGIQALEPFFDEWRGMVIKNILKDVTNYFQPPPTEAEAEEDEVWDEGDSEEAEGEEATADEDNVVAASAAPASVAFIRPSRIVSTIALRPAGMGRVTLN
jgi:DNA repair exonuclease SbcCD ATPase subunit